ncbi:Mannose-6-phosphate isomerase 2 [Apostasia shenzhenica]|uniref:mannose-6-phosphate isomerase n=1 Tax=Apostasia shenzhenica TaxID=1088818 RepID=A0A2I0A144_9ASPA|nr:Mannose-6-phosphate isomerase 2 [Apostasia shenzhenica]
MAAVVAEERRPLRLRFSVQNYDWGRVGEESAVARLYVRNSEEEIDGRKPYAELWMGTHDSGHSFVEIGRPEAEPVTLKSWIAANPSALGEKAVKRWGNDLPFLFKILSVAKALSIQAHPDKELAGVLHKTRPELYKDANHKPEMAIALTDFTALCGFVSVKELKDVFINVPEILELVGNESAAMAMNIKDHYGQEEGKAALRTVFTTLVTASKAAVSEALKKLKIRLDMEQKTRRLTEKEELALLLEKQYPDDVGVMATFFFNYVNLSPGEALYIGANEPHAYVSGDCVECMASSDNVVRAGLTPKYRDVQTLCSMLTYKQGFPQILRGNSLNKYVTRYTPPFDEFEVDHIFLPSEESIMLSGIPGPSIFIVVTGEGRLQVNSVIEDLFEGNVLFVPANCEFCLCSGSNRPIELYRAGINSKFLF